MAYPPIEVLHQLHRLFRHWHLLAYPCTRCLKCCPWLTSACGWTKRTYRHTQCHLCNTFYHDRGAVHQPIHPHRMCRPTAKAKRLESTTTTGRWQRGENKPINILPCRAFSRSSSFLYTCGHLKIIKPVLLITTRPFFSYIIKYNSYLANCKFLSLASAHQPIRPHTSRNRPIASIPNRFGYRFSNPPHRGFHWSNSKCPVCIHFRTEKK